MWHFGSDSPNEYTGEKFEVAREEGENAVMHIYTNAPEWRDQNQKRTPNRTKLVRRTESFFC
jgi:hypothetical protein